MSWYDPFLDPLRALVGNTTQRQVNEEEERLAEQRTKNERERRDEEKRQREQREYYERQENIRREEARRQREENSKKEEELREELRKLKEKNELEMKQLEEEGRNARKRISAEMEEERKAMDRKYVEKIRNLKKKHEECVERKHLEIKEEQNAFREKERVIEEEIGKLQNERIKNSKEHGLNTLEQLKRANEELRREQVKGHNQVMGALKENHQLQIETGELRIEESLEIGRQLMIDLNEESNRKMRNLALDLTNQAILYQNQLARLPEYSEETDSLKKCLQDLRWKKKCVMRSFQNLRREMLIPSFCSSEIKENLFKWLEGVEDVHAEANELCNELRRCLEGNPEKITELCMKIGNFSNELQNAQNNLRIEN